MRERDSIQHGMAPHSLLSAESEDVTHMERLLAQVPAVQTYSHRPVAQLAERQSHSTEVQQATAELTHTHTKVCLPHWMNASNSLEFSGYSSFTTTLIGILKLH